MFSFQGNTTVNLTGDATNGKILVQHNMHSMFYSFQYVQFAIVQFALIVHVIPIWHLWKLILPKSTSVNDFYSLCQLVQFALSCINYIDSHSNHLKVGLLWYVLKEGDVGS